MHVFQTAWNHFSMPVRTISFFFCFTTQIIVYTKLEVPSSKISSFRYALYVCLYRVPLRNSRQYVTPEIMLVITIKMIKSKIWKAPFVCYCMKNNPYDEKCHTERHLYNILISKTVSYGSLTSYNMLH